MAQLSTSTLKVQISNFQPLLYLKPMVRQIKTQRNCFWLFFCLVALFAPVSAFSQQTDTIRFYSKSFNAQREIYVKTPEAFKYRSARLKLPVIYILDGQHEWFVEPLLSTIKYLQYTHAIPTAIVVVIPLKNRIRECGINKLTDTLPLHQFITEEIPDQIAKYGPNGYNLLIGHSFSASFALYSMLKAPTFYHAVFANSPLDQLHNLVGELNSSSAIEKKNIFISIGGIDLAKDFYHRKHYDTLKKSYPDFFKRIHTFEANFSGHTAVPIVANPTFLTELFYNYSKRYNQLAPVDENYKLTSKPESIAAVLKQIADSSYLDNVPFPIELPDVNGITSRYNNSGYTDYGIAIYELALEYYPKYYDFHLSLGDLYLKKDRNKAIFHYQEAIKLAKEFVVGAAEQKEILAEIRKRM
jgi:tetratricopeptide (TPR) repeat protein